MQGFGYHDKGVNHMLQTAQKIMQQGEEEITLVFLGDSVTYGSFEISGQKGFPQVNVDHEQVYHRKLRTLIEQRYPGAKVRYVNSGIGGESTQAGYERMPQDVLAHNPSLCVVCYGLNDVNKGPDGLELYEQTMDAILTRLQQAGIEAIVLTPNMLNTHPTDQLVERLNEYSIRLAQYQNDGTMDRYMDTVRSVAAKHNVPVADTYARWKREFADKGISTNEHLSNHLNHPTREQHQWFADDLFEVLFG